MGISSIMDIAKGALFAQQTALQVISNNVANVNTEGYMRQTAVLDESESIQTAFGQLGNGVTVRKVMAIYDKYLEASVAKENNATEEWKTYESYFGRIESVLNEDNTSLTANITKFFNAWQTLSTDPTSNTARTNVGIEGENVTRSIRNIYGELGSIQTEANNNVKQTVDEINGILQSIAQLNAKIYESIGGSNDATVVSQMTQLVKELSGIINIQTFTDQNGGLAIMTSDGKLLVDRGIVNELGAEIPATGDFYRVVWNGSSSASMDITDSIKSGSGSLKSFIDIRDNQIPKFMTTINDLAKSLITEVDNLHYTGYNANGTNEIYFFKHLNPTIQNVAAKIDVSDEVKADVGNIAATSSLTSTAGNDIALALADLGSSSITIGVRDTTYTDYAASVASSIGSLSKNAQDISEYHQNLLSTVQAQRDSVSGVTIDEEMTNLIKYQYAYQAAARLLNTADTLFSSLLAIGS
jgi:flagellar hook-associated protein 1 FlgK